MIFLSKIVRLPSTDLPTRMIMITPPSSTLLDSDAAVDDDLQDAICHDPLVEWQKTLQTLHDEIDAQQVVLTALQQQTEKDKQEAQQHVHNLLEQARLDEQSIRDKAYQSGEKEGFKAGEESAKSQYQQLIVQAQEVLLCAQIERKERVKSSESLIVSLAVDIAKKVVASQVLVDDSVAARLVSGLLHEVDKAKRVELRVSPIELDIALGHRRSYEQSLHHQAELLIIPDASLSKGDVVIVTEIGSIDSRLSTRLQEVEHALLTCAQHVEKGEASDE